VREKKQHKRADPCNFALHLAKAMQNAY